MKSNPKKKHKTLSQVKKEVWAVFSRYIRLRDCLKTTGCSSFGLCVTCNKRYHFKLLQAGHFIPGRHNANLFSEKGTHAQCYNCNINLRGNTLEYRRKIIEMYGARYDEVLEAVYTQVDIIMLDNMDLTEMRKSVNLIHETNSENGRNIRIEVSGNIVLDTVREVAETGVDYISIGSLTHSVKNHDFSLLFKEL